MSGERSLFAGSVCLWQFWNLQPHATAIGQLGSPKTFTGNPGICGILGGLQLICVIILTIEIGDVSPLTRAPHAMREITALVPTGVHWRASPEGGGMPLWGPSRFWPGSGLVLRCLGPGFTVLVLGPG